MCLAIPGRILTTAGDDPATRLGRVDFDGVVREISLALTPEAGAGDHVVTQAGFAIRVIGEDQARAIRDHLRTIAKVMQNTAGARDGG